LLKGCYSNFEVNISEILKLATIFLKTFLKHMKIVPYNKQYVLGERLKTIITKTSNLTDPLQKYFICDI